MARKTLFLGKVDGYGRGVRNCRATFEWELKETDKGPVFSMSAAVWNHIGIDWVMGGQCCEKVLGMVYARGSAQARRMVEVWKRYHLNDMRAGCLHQRARRWVDERIDPTELPNAHANRDERGILAVWVYEKEHPKGLLCKPCPTCGYKYGSAWLYEAIPEHVLREIRSWEGDLDAQN